MSADNSSRLLSPVATRILGWSLFFIILLVASFNFPLMPSASLDPSWRMALGYFFENDMQFGKDVVFTYGPLGFIMGKTFSGLQFWELIAGQLILSFIATIVLLRQGLRLSGYTRVYYIAFILLFGIFYEDALHMIVITILGFELLRLKDSPRYSYIALIGAVLAFYSQIKFTDLLLTVFIIVLVLGYGVWNKKWKAAICLATSFLIAYLGMWVGFGQSITNLPAYFHASWEISQGYQWAMGLPSPASPLWKGIVVLVGLIAYAFFHLRIHSNKPRAIANVLLLGAFVYLNWKHGFVRADGHMIGFFFCALLPITTYPHLLDDPHQHRKAHRWFFVFLLSMSIWGLNSVGIGVIRYSLANFQTRVWGNVTAVFNWEKTRQDYRDRLGAERAFTSMPKTQHIVGRATLDILGQEQGVALFNKFNYLPRPVIQSYSTYTPMLAGLNRDFISSDHAPEYILMKLQSLDLRLPTMDDAHVLRLLPHRYSYSHMEKDFGVWKRKPGAFDANDVKPKPILVETVAVSQPINLEPYNKQPLWLKIDLQPSLLGRILNFLYKPPQVMLSITSTDDISTNYLMPLPQGRTGFIVNPLIEDYFDYMRFTSNTSKKRIRSFTISIAPDKRKFFSNTADIVVATLPTTSMGESFFPPSTEDKFPMFHTFPVKYDAFSPVSIAQIEERDFAILHAPSKMVFNLPAGAKTLSGYFGIVEAAYTQGNRSDGAHFIIYWSDGTRRSDLYQRLLQPATVVQDQGEHHFSIPLGHLKGGRLYFEIKGGPLNDNTFDWAGWSEIKISR